MRKDWKMWVLIGLVLSVLNIGGMVKIDFLGIQIVSGLGAAIIMYVMLEPLLEKYLKHGKSNNC